MKHLSLYLAALSICLVLAVRAEAADGPDKDRFIVAFQPGKSQAGRTAVEAAGGKILRDLVRHDAVAAHIAPQALPGLASNPNVAYVEQDVPRHKMSETVPYGITAVQADQVSDAAAANRTVCIIDSGYYTGHEDLAANYVTGTNDPGTGNWFEDTNGHGTHVAGTIAAIGGNGIGVVGAMSGHNVHLHIVKVFDETGWAYSSDLVAALDVCRDNGANVVNMSLGGNFKSRMEEAAFQQADYAGVLSVAAAGNDGNTRKSYPASYSSVISVAAIDENKLIADFSQQNDQVELAAPGVAVLSTVPWIATDTLTVGGTTYDGNHIEFAALGTASGALVDGGLCTAAGSWSGAVVLCERGDITFYDKVMSVENGGGSAAVIYNNVPGNFFGTLGDGNSSTIPAIGLSQDDGQILVATQLGAVGQVVSNLQQPGSGYEAWDGTSMATPHVSGVAALIWSYDPSWTNADIRGALAETAEDLGAPGRDNAYGFGLIQARAALDYLEGTACTVTESPEVSCADGVDNDCDGWIDLDDSDCWGGSCASAGVSCSADDQCCSGKCRGKPGQKLCR